MPCLGVDFAAGVWRYLVCPMVQGQFNECQRVAIIGEVSLFQLTCLCIAAVRSNTSKLSLQKHPLVTDGAVIFVVENIVRIRAFIGSPAF